ncbi:MAG: ABC transporter ATP-binding protein [Bacilli bacterium]|nr:ABC transporter ATP-binding protein [Bacilli bacterium]
MAENNRSSEPRRVGPGPRGPRGAMPIEKPKDIKGSFKRLVKYIGYNKGLFIALIIVSVLTTLCHLFAPVIQSEIINNLTNIQTSPFFDENGFKIDLSLVYDSVLKLIIVLGAVYLLSSLLTYFQSRFSAKLSQKTVYKLRTDLFGKFVKLPIKFLDTHSHGDLMSRMTNDVENVSNTISQSIASLISGILTMVGFLTIMFYYSWLLTLVCLLTIGLTIFASKILTGKMRRYYKNKASLLGNLNGHVEEMITGYKTVVAYNKEEDVEEEFADISHKLTKVSIVADVWAGSMGPIMNFISNTCYVLIAFVGAYIALAHPFNLTIGIGTIALFLNSSKQFTRPINEIAQLLGQIFNAMAGVERVFEIMDADNEVDEGKMIIDEDSFEGNISFNHVNFSYVEGHQVLTDFTLDVKKGQKIALVGATGSGKTTVVNLLMRFYDVNSGEILIDGVNINDIEKKELRDTIAIVLQDTVLFKDTIGNNVKYGKQDATFDEIKQASILSNANFFVKKLPNRYDTVLSEGGSNLSQGQRQLLSIARAILADPKILILDEATSSVDTRTEKNIQDAMSNLMKNRTSLIIAHRLSTIQDADVIVVIDKGKIVEKGNHYELLEQKGRYYDLYMTQFAGKQI